MLCSARRWGSKNAVLIDIATGTILHKLEPGYLGYWLYNREPKTKQTTWKSAFLPGHNDVCIVEVPRQGPDTGPEAWMQASGALR